MSDELDYRVRQLEAERLRPVPKPSTAPCTALPWSESAEDYFTPAVLLRLLTEDVA